MLKILSNAEQRDVLLETMELINGTCIDISRTAFDNVFPNKYELHGRKY